MSDYQKAVWMPNSNYFPDTGKKSFLILHSTAGGNSAQEIAKYFQGTEGTGNPVSSHYIVGQDGTVVQCIAEKDGAYAQGVVNSDNWSGNPNLYTISIEHVKSSNDNSEPLTPAQRAASFALIKDICQRNGIGMHDADDTTGITGHFAIDPVNRARCPGSFDWDALWAYLGNGETTTMASIDITTPGVSNYFEGSGDVWKCKKNNFLVGHGILGFYKKFGGDALCGITYLGLPTSNETVVLGPKGTTIGVVYQRFERGVVVYDPRHQVDNPPQSGDCYLLHLDNYPGQDPRIADLQKQIAALKQPTPTNLVQINTLSKQIADDVQLILNLSSAQ